MKTILVLSTVLVSLGFSLSASANGPDQTFSNTQLTYWWAGAEDVVLGGGVKETCNQQDQAYVSQAAQQAALAECNGDRAGYRCFVSATQITFNGPLDDNMMAKYGLKLNQFSLNTPHGCEATATVFGFR